MRISAPQQGGEQEAGSSGDAKRRQRMVLHGLAGATAGIPVARLEIGKDLLAGGDHVADIAFRAALEIVRRIAHFRPHGAGLLANVACTVRSIARQHAREGCDLGAQFGDLILIQRGFQASSQIISITNDMIQQLFGIRGQG